MSGVLHGLVPVRKSIDHFSLNPYYFFDTQIYLSYIF